MSATSSTKSRYANGLATLDEIIRAAEDVLVESGHATLSLRRVAEECGLKTGHISYYFPTKSQLIQALLESIMSKYKTEMDALENVLGASPEDLIRKYMRTWIAANGEIRTSKTFIEIWSMANNDPSIVGHIEFFYQNGLSRLERFIRRLNTKLTDRQVASIALYALASMEGIMVFVNKDRQTWSQVEDISANAINAVVHLAKNPV